MTKAIIPQGFVQPGDLVRVRVWLDAWTYESRQVVVLNRTSFGSFKAEELGRPEKQGWYDDEQVVEAVPGACLAYVRGLEAKQDEIAGL